MLPDSAGSSFVVTKHSWKGKYRRILNLSPDGVSTSNPSSMEVTNTWKLCDMVAIQPSSPSATAVATNGAQASTGAVLEFQLIFRKGRKSDSIKFSSEWRPVIITEALRLLQQTGNELNASASTTWTAFKYHWSEQRLPVKLRVGAYSLEQLDPSSHRVLATYCFKDITALFEVTDYPGGFVVQVGTFGRLHFFAAEARHEILQQLVERANSFVGLTIDSRAGRSGTITFDKFGTSKFGKYGGDDHITSVSEFVVYKLTLRHADPVRRQLCLTDTCLVERDPATYSIVTLRPLSEVCAIVRDPSQPQLVAFQYASGDVRKYTSTERDAVIASFLDGVRGSGNRDVHVRSGVIERAKRLSPLNVLADEEVESSHLKFLVTPPPTWNFYESVARFNANVAYSGLLHAVTQEHLFAENKEKLIHGAITALMAKDCQTDDLDMLEQQFHALRRLVASKAGFSGFTTLPGFREKIGVKVAKALKLGHDGISHAAIDMLCALMEPMHEDYDLKQEQLNKYSLLSSDRFLDGLLDMWTTHVMRGTGALVVAAMLDFLTFALCAPYSETTDGKQFDVLLEQVADRGRTLYRLFQHPSHTIVKGAGLLMKAIIEEGTEDTGRKMQLLALAEGALPIHLLTALFTRNADNRLMMRRQLSRHLIALWTADNDSSFELLQRIFPAGLLYYLTSDGSSPVSEKDRLNIRDNLQLAISDQEKYKVNPLLKAAGKGLKTAKDKATKTADLVAEHTMRYTDEARKIAERHFDIALQHWRTRMGKEWSARNGIATQDNSQLVPATSSTAAGVLPTGGGKFQRTADRPIVLRKRRERIKSSANWPLFYFQFGQDHAKPNLIWNYKTRQELMECLESEVQAFLQDRELAGGALISWNYAEFAVGYPSLSDEIKIGDYFLRLLLEEDQSREEESLICKSSEFFNDLYHRFLLTPKIEMKCLCLQALTIVYGRHFVDIGCFHDTKYIVAMLDRTLDRMERDRLLLFLSKLILHRDNAVEVLQASGVRVLVDLLPLAHLHTSRAVINSHTCAIEASPDSSKASQEKEWYYGNADKERNGPVSISELVDLFEKKDIHARTKVWAQGLEGWRLLQQVPQLKWSLLAKGQAVMNETEMATLILDMLINLCKFFSSRDPDGAIIRPLPKVKSSLSEPAHLPHIVQLLLTFDPVLVERVANLLHLVLEDNARLPTLYLTGGFFFILMYVGSNLLPIARFLWMSHNKQAFRSEDSENMSSRSILAQMLPEAMVAYLDNHGPEKFAQIFLGEFDTPEAIWNSEMRQFMIQKIAYHLSDFTPRLKSNVRALYQYCPIPILSYPDLESELFCDIYYLRNLCNEAKFPEWPVCNPLKLLKEVLLAWKLEVEKKPSSMTEADALSVLGLPANADRADDTKIRRAYFKMAQNYHPDKNPNGREMFEKVNAAYEFLCNSKNTKFSDRPDPGNIVLILRTQSILFSRYAEELHPYKYAGYPMLIKTIRMETDDDKLFSKSAPLLAAASECAFYTVKCSSLNAEELRRENGLEVLYKAFERCTSVLSHSSKTDDLAVSVCGHITKFYAVASLFQMCRERMVEMPELIKNICRIFYYKHLTALCATAAECVSALAVDGILQMHLLQAGVLWHLLVFMFDYDFTLEESGIDAAEETSHQMVANKLAKLAVIACGRLVGVFTQEHLTSPRNPVIEECLNALLTPYVVKLIAKSTPEEVLKVLTSNMETPYIIWDNSTRAELLEFIESERTSTIRRGVCDPSFGSEFKFTAHKGELMVGQVLVRVYNQQPMFPLDEPKRFAVDLLQFLNGETQYLYSLLALDESGSPPPSDRLINCQMALEALSNVIKHNRGTDIQCIGHFKLLFSLLRLERCPKMQGMALQVLCNVTSSSECVDDIGASQVLASLLYSLYTLAPERGLALQVLHSLMGDTKLVKECLHFGGVVCLVFIFCCSSDTCIRQKSADVLSKMAADKLMGPKARIALSKFLPEIFLDAMRKSVEACIQLFEGCHENPELIWNENSRSKLTAIVTNLAQSHMAHLKTNPEIGWAPSGTDLAPLQCLEKNELVVSGIYIRLFIANPGWVLRKPREFMSDLWEVILRLMNSATSLEALETITTAMVKLLEAQPSLADTVPATGYISRMLSGMSTCDIEVLKPGVLIVNELARSAVCVEAIAKCDAIGPLKRSLKLRSDLIFPACEVLSRLFHCHHDTLVMQALSCNLVQDLLALLESPLHEQPTASGTKALIVNTLKDMQCSLAYGEEVSQLLKASRIWGQYEQQKHDLFLTDRPNAGYLTATPGVAGYLTATSSIHSSSSRLAGSNQQPPPMDQQDTTHFNNPLL